MNSGKINGLAFNDDKSYLCCATNNGLVVYRTLNLTKVINMGSFFFQLLLNKYLFRISLHIYLFIYFSILFKVIIILINNIANK